MEQVKKQRGPSFDDYAVHLLLTMVSNNKGDLR